MIAGQRVKSVIVTVGEELLSGETVDTNGSWLSKRMAFLGIPVIKRLVVGDDSESIKNAVSEGMRLADLVMVTGGLGPTPDDITRPTVADLLGLDLILDKNLLREIKDKLLFLGSRGLPPSNVVQAKVPQGAKVIPNTRGSAPGLWIDYEGQVVVLIPGVPRELYEMYELAIEDLIREHFDGHLTPLTHRTFHTTGIPESVLNERLDAVRIELPDEIKIASLPNLGGVSIRMSVSGTPDKMRTILDEAETVLSPILKPYRFDSDSGNLVDAMAKEFIRSGLFLGVAESCTGGLLAKRITDSPGSSAYFHGGIVAYSDEIKKDILGVEESILQAEGAVSESVAMAMAQGIVKLLDTDVGIGITGIAGPEGGTEDKPVGTVWYGIYYQGQVSAYHKVFIGDREAIREKATQAALHLLFKKVTAAS